jgi:hypothetical protein
VAYPLDIAPWAVCQACTISSRRRYSAVDPSAMVRPEIVRRASVSRNRMRPHPWRAFRYPEGEHCVAGSDVHVPSGKAGWRGVVLWRIYRRSWWVAGVWAPAGWGASREFWRLCTCWVMTRYPVALSPVSGSGDPWQSVFV